MTDYRFGKDEKLKSRKVIQEIFDQGLKLKSFPVFVVYSISESDQPEVKIGFSVSKRKFKRAVDRNQIKRLMREAYRLNKTELVSKMKSENQSLNMMMIYLKNELCDYQEINKSVLNLINQLSRLKKI